MMAVRYEKHHTSAIVSPSSSLLEVDDSQQSYDENDILQLDSTSITSSVLDYEYENGRRYHAYKAGSYPIPNDEAELERIDIKHHMVVLLYGGRLHLAPLVDPKMILDIGTGTGIWVMEMADLYPECTIIGTDLSPVQPTWVPDNVRFEIDDVESREWSWRENHFDYIHSRFMVVSISDWQEYLHKAFKHCKPGGFFEIQELDPRFTSDDGSLSETSALCQWSGLICDAAEKYNRPVPRYTEYKKWFENAGFVDIKETLFKSPTNSWPKSKLLKEVSKFQLLAHIEGLEGISLGLMTRGLGWKADEVKVLMARMRPELKNKAIHSYQTNIVVVGCKPIGTEPSTSSALVQIGDPSTQSHVTSPCTSTSPSEFAEPLENAHI